MLTTLINPLHTTEYINNQINCIGFYDPTRMTGDTTATALELLSRAIRNPYTKVESKTSTQADALCLALNLKETVKALNLRKINVILSTRRVLVTFE